MSSYIDEKRYSVLVDYLTSCKEGGELRNSRVYPVGATANEKRRIRQQAAMFVLKERLLYYRATDAVNEIRFKREIANAKERTNIIRACHDGVDGCHYGRNKTRIGQTYWWKGLNRDVDQYCRRCDVCQQVNAKVEGKKAELTSPHSSSKQNAHLSDGDRLATLDVFPLMGIDLFKMPTSSMGINWNLHPFVPSSQQTAEDQSECLACSMALLQFIKLGTIITKMNSIKQTKKAIFLVRVDWEEQVHVLWCTEIESCLFKLTGIEHKISSSYHPQTNGLDERTNQTLTRALIKFSEAKENWDENIDAALYAYRIAKQDSSQFSTFFIMYNRNPRIAIDHEFSCKATTKVTGKNTCTYDMEETYATSASTQCPCCEDAVNLVPGSVQPAPDLTQRLLRDMMMSCDTCNRDVRAGDYDSQSATEPAQGQGYDTLQLGKDTQSDVKPRYVLQVNNLFDQLWNENQRSSSKLLTPEGRGKEKRAISPFRLSPTICLQMWRILSSPARETPDTLSHLEKRADDSPPLMMLLTVCIFAHLVFTVLEQAAVVSCWAFVRYMNVIGY
ncbi:hypothetical protein EMCRGX_G019555 [Ephydatia muelleri]